MWDKQKQGWGEPRVKRQLEVGVLVAQSLIYTSLRLTASSMGSAVHEVW